MSEWKEYKLEEIYEFASGLSKGRADFGFGFGFLSYMSIFENYFVPEELNSLVNSTEKERQSCSIKRGDVFLTRTSETTEDLGISSVALKDYPDATFNGFTKRLRPTGKIEVLPEYIGFYFRSPKFRATVSGMSSMTTRASLNNSILSELPIVLPSFKTQTSIAELLFSIHNKIDLLRRQNQTLEQLAQTIFKQWFVQFQYPGANGKMQQTELGEVPEGWGVGTIGEIYKTTSGGTPSRAISEYYQDGTVEWIKSKELDGHFVLNTEEKITETAVKESSAKLIPENSVLVAMYGNTVGEMGLTGKEATCNQAICGIIENGDYPFTYVYLWLKHNLQKLKNLSIGSAQQNLSQIVVSSFEIIIPDTSTAKLFSKAINPLFEKIKINQKEIQTLTQLRDSLLPRLMSGKLRVG